jgi:formylglycine-generating enzyme required for sulfatase activity
MESVSWHDTHKFIAKLAEMTNSDAFRLPTEAEWEFCCRAGFSGDFCFDGRAGRLQNYAWYADNAGFQPHAVGLKKPNAFGLYDMHGLVWEWTSTVEKAYPYRADDGREDPGSPNPRVIRGGSWLTSDVMCRSGFREYHLPTHRDHDIGFRLAVS